MIDYIAKFRELHMEDNDSYPQNDIGMARLFFDLHGDRACFVVESKAWYAWDGRRWVKDEGGFRVMELCKVFVENLFLYAQSVGGDSGLFIKSAAALQGRKRRETLLCDARSIAPKSLADFDRDKLLFNCRNGTFHLTDMALRPHSPEDYLTRLSCVHYAPEAACPRWTAFVSEVMQGDEETARFLQKALGYCLSGETSLECFFILYGSSTRNGKSTACETVAWLLGDYAGTAQPETLARRSRDGSAPSPDIARLKGVRMVSVPEPERGLELNAALIKQLTGGDTYTGRFLHENPVEFVPEFKIFINTNHLPRVGDDTIFSSDRVKLIPFERHFSPEEQDTGLKRRFREQENVSGIFSWLLEGYRLLQTEGLTIPDKVAAAIHDYRHETDIVGTFLGATLMEAEGCRIQTSALYRRYTAWAKENGYRALNNKNFVGELRRRYEIKRNGVRGFEVVGVDFLPANVPW